MNLVDSCGWLEYLADGPNAGAFEKPLSNLSELLVPTLSLFEVFRVVLRERGEEEALQAAALMRKGRVIPLTEEIALWGAKVSLERRLPMADSLIYATALQQGAVLWTQDADFQGLPKVRYFPKP